MLHSLATGRVEPKLAGIEWALATLDARWHALIAEAWGRRKGQYARYGSPIGEAAVARTLAFIAHARCLTPAAA